MFNKFKTWSLKPKNALFTCKVSASNPSGKRTWVIGNTQSSTMDFYFRSRQRAFADYGEVDISDDNWLVHPSITDEDSLLILVRDVPLALLKKLQSSSNRPTHIVWFIDDDIPSINSDKTLPKAYRNRLSRWYKSARPLLETLCNQVWVSTNYLAEKYQLQSEQVLPPLQLDTMQQDMVHCFYHGSGSHTLDWEFTRKLVELIQKEYTNTWFELIGDHSVYKAFRGIPRVNILHPLPWSEYKAMTANRKMDIGLVPLADTPFNLGRSHCKLLDIQRQNAVGVYSSRMSHADSIESEQAGFIAGDTLEDWLAAFGKAMSADRRLICRNSTRLLTKLGDKYL